MLPKACRWPLQGTWKIHQMLPEGQPKAPRLTRSSRKICRKHPEGLPEAPGGFTESSWKVCQKLLEGLPEVPSLLIRGTWRIYQMLPKAWKFSEASGGFTGGTWKVLRAFVLSHMRLRRWGFRGPSDPWESPRNHKVNFIPCFRHVARGGKLPPKKCTCHPRFKANGPVDISPAGPYDDDL